MRVYKDTSFEFGLMPWELTPPHASGLFFVKATFELAQNSPASIAPEQRPITGEVPYDDVDAPSVQCESDFALFKPRAEWLLCHAQAHAPGGSPAQIVPVRVRVGPLDKQLVVWGDRRWTMSLLGSKATDPVPFTSMPLRWERSYGGPGYAPNPCGAGREPVEVDGERVDRVPNIESPRAPHVSKEDHHPPAGMFPIPSTWDARASKLGTFDEIWRVSRWPYFPSDFDPAFYQAAPPDQWLDGPSWRGDETIELENLRPDQPSFRSRLPGLRARMFIEWTSGGKPTTFEDDPAESTEHVSAAEFQEWLAQQQPPEGEGGAGPPAPPGELVLAPTEELSARERADLMVEPDLTEIRMALDTIQLDPELGQAICLWRGLVTGIADHRFSNVERLFIVHEPLDADRDVAYYQRRLHQLLVDEILEDEAEDDEDAHPGDEATDAPDLEVERAKALASIDGVFAAIAGMYEAVEEVAPEVTAAHVAAAIRAEGYEPPEEIADPEPPPTVPWDPTPDSLLRLVAMVRKISGIGFAGADLVDAPYSGLDLSDCDFSEAKLDGADLRGAILTRAKLDGASLVGARLEEANLTHASLPGADLSEVRAERARFHQTLLDEAYGTLGRFAGATFEGSRMIGVALEQGDFRGCNLRTVNLESGDLSFSILDEADFTGSRLVDASIEGCRARRAVFERCDAADLRASEGADLSGARFVLVDAPRAQLQQAHCHLTNFSGSNLAGADFERAVLFEANLVRCKLVGGRFAEADLRHALLMASDLFEAELDQANLYRTDLRGANLFSASFYRARRDGALLDGAELGRTLVADG